MISQRLPLVLDGQDQPKRAVVYRARAGIDLSALAEAKIEIVQGFKPDHDALEDAGFSVQAELDADTPEFDLAVVCIPRSKAEARALIAQAASCAQRVLVDGQKTDGIDSLLKEVRKRASVTALISKAHGKAFIFEATELQGVFADWMSSGALNVIDGFTTRLGVFSAEKIDKASAALVAALPEKLPAKIGDFGAGWGYLSRHILEKEGVKKLHVIEAEAAALACARENVADTRAEFHWADATRFSIKPMLDGIIMNPPFHTERAGDPALGQAFIASAANCLAPHGHLWMVANRHLPYEVTLGQHFLEVEELDGTGAFKILHASKPLRSRPRTA
jgi:16S rRNA (guanine1207-N2)-methyltransferase